MARIMPELEFRSFHSHRSCEIMPKTTRLATLSYLEIFCWPRNAHLSFQIPHKETMSTGRPTHDCPTRYQNHHTQTQMYFHWATLLAHEPSRLSSINVQHIPALAKMFCAGIFISAPSITHDEDPEARQ
jgi:hypothetical protein